MDKIETLVWVRGTVLKHTHREYHVWAKDKRGAKRVVHLPHSLVEMTEVVDKEMKFLVPQYLAYKEKLPYKHSKGPLGEGPSNSYINQGDLNGNSEKTSA
jgi:hypothetical protein